VEVPPEMVQGFFEMVLLNHEPLPLPADAPAAD
jgi:hypothetical protein